MVSYQFEVDDDEWNAWKETVPRSQSLKGRIIELLEADVDDRIVSASADRLAETKEVASGGRIYVGTGREGEHYRVILEPVEDS